MSKRNPPQLWGLPNEVHPTEFVCYQVPVPKDKFYIAAFMGALLDLGTSKNWARDPLHKASEVAQVWREIFNNLETCVICAPNDTGYAGAGGGDEDLMLRQNPDNPCELQNSVDGVTWCTWADLSLCVSSGQPGAGAPQPTPGGGAECYSAKMQATAKWLLPTSVNTGDTILLQSTNGAATDGGSNWYCPDGSLFVLGACLAGTQTYYSGNPVPLSPTMAIILKIGATFYKITEDTPFTVPAGIANQQVTFQVNDSTLTDNSGELTFEVCVTNNAASLWSHTLSFAAGPQKFAAHAYNPGDVAGAAYVLGTGWNSTQSKAGDGGASTNRYTVDQIFYEWTTPTVLKSVTVKMNTTVGTNPAGSTLGQNVQARTAGGSVTLASVSPSNGSGQTMSWTGTQTAIGLQIDGFISDAGGGGTGTGTMTWVELTITGSGFDPWA